MIGARNAELTFVGAAGTVTGSKHLLTLDGRRIFIDCGLFQGVVDVRALNDVPLPVPAAQIDAVVITHGHLDHVGYLPKLVHDGFSGPDLLDAADEGLDANRARRLGQSATRTPSTAVPSRTASRAAAVLRSNDVARRCAWFSPIALERPFDLSGVARATYHNAGTSSGPPSRAGVRRQARRLLRRSRAVRPAAALRSARRSAPPTFSSANRPTATASIRRIRSTSLLQRCSPASRAAVRSSFPHLPSNARKISCSQSRHCKRSDPQIATPARAPRQPDGGQRSTHSSSTFPDAHKPIPRRFAGTPFGVRNFTLARDDRRIESSSTTLTGPTVIISASGMASGGRVLHHLHNHLADPTSTIIFPGYQGAGTLGYLLTHGAHSVRSSATRCRFAQRSSTSRVSRAHADQNDLKRWFGNLPVAAAPLCGARRSRVGNGGRDAGASAFGWPAQVARRGLRSTFNRAAQLRKRQQRAGRARDPSGDRCTQTPATPSATATTNGRRARRNAFAKLRRRGRGAFHVQRNRRQRRRARFPAASLGVGALSGKRASCRPTNAALSNVSAVRRSCRSPRQTANCRPADIEPYLQAGHGVHFPQPRAISISQATEFGDLYEVEELAELCAFAHERGLFVHLDGARIANAAAALGVSLRALTADAGVDVLSFGGTKNGLMLGEAICFFTQLERRRGAVRREAGDAARVEDAISRRAVRTFVDRRSVAALRLTRQCDDGTTRRSRASRRGRAHHAPGSLQRRVCDARRKRDRAPAAGVLFLRLRSAAARGALDDALGDHAGRRRRLRRRPRALRFGASSVGGVSRRWRRGGRRVAALRETPNGGQPNHYQSSDGRFVDRPFGMHSNGFRLPIGA